MCSPLCTACPLHTTDLFSNHMNSSREDDLTQTHECARTRLRVHRAVFVITSSQQKGQRQPRWKNANRSPPRPPTTRHPGPEHPPPLSSPSSLPTKPQAPKPKQIKRPECTLTSGAGNGQVSNRIVSQTQFFPHCRSALRWNMPNFMVELTNARGGAP